MRLHIPDIGDHLRLEEDWTFRLHNERRNDGFITLLGLDQSPEIVAAKRRSEAAEAKFRSLKRGDPGYDEAYGEFLKFSPHRRVKIDWPVTLPKGTVLKVDRVYIRKGASDFSSLTFYVIDTPLFSKNTKSAGAGGKKSLKKRFFASLADVNKMTVTNLPREGAKVA